MAELVLVFLSLFLSFLSRLEKINKFKDTLLVSFSLLFFSWMVVASQLIYSTSKGQLGTDRSDLVLFFKYYFRFCPGAVENFGRFGDPHWYLFSTDVIRLKSDPNVGSNVTLYKCKHISLSSSLYSLCALVSFV